MATSSEEKQKFNRCEDLKCLPFNKDIFKSLLKILIVLEKYIKNMINQSDIDITENIKLEPGYYEFETDDLPKSLGNLREQIQQLELIYRQNSQSDSSEISENNNDSFSNFFTFKNNSINVENVPDNSMRIAIINELTNKSAELSERLTNLIEVYKKENSPERLEEIRKRFRKIYKKIKLLPQQLDTIRNNAEDINYSSPKKFKKAYSNAEMNLTSQLSHLIRKISKLTKICKKFFKLHDISQIELVSPKIKKRRSSQIVEIGSTVAAFELSDSDPLQSAKESKALHRKSFEEEKGKSKIRDNVENEMPSRNETVLLQKGQQTNEIESGTKRKVIISVNDGVHLKKKKSKLANFSKNGHEAETYNNIQNCLHDKENNESTNNNVNELTNVFMNGEISLDENIKKNCKHKRMNENNDNQFRDSSPKKCKYKRKELNKVDENKPSNNLETNEQEKKYSYNKVSVKNKKDKLDTEDESLPAKTKRKINSEINGDKLFSNNSKNKLKNPKIIVNTEGGKHESHSEKEIDNITPNNTKRKSKEDNSKCKNKEQVCDVSVPDNNCEISNSHDSGLADNSPNKSKSKKQKLNSEENEDNSFIEKEVDDTIRDVCVTSKLKSKSKDKKIVKHKNQQNEVSSDEEIIFNKIAETSKVGDNDLAKNKQIILNIETSNNVTVTDEKNKKKEHKNAEVSENEIKRNKEKGKKYTSKATISESESDTLDKIRKDKKKRKTECVANSENNTALDLNVEAERILKKYMDNISPKNSKTLNNDEPLSKQNNATYLRILEDSIQAQYESEVENGKVNTEFLMALAIINDTNLAEKDKSKFLADVCDIACENSIISDEKIEKLSDLNVCIDWDVPDIHQIETSISSFGRPTDAQKSQLLQLGAKFQVPFTKKEDELIKKNWKTFCKQHDLEDDPRLFMTSRHNGKLHIPYSERKKFVQYLARGLPQRYLCSVYRRFKVLFKPYKTGKFTEEEDKIILTHVNSFSDHKTIKFVPLVPLLDRDRVAIEQRYLAIKRNEEATSTCEWKKDMQDDLLKHLMDILNVNCVDDLRTLNISRDIFNQVAEKLNVSVTKVQHQWYLKIYTQLFAEKPLFIDRIRVKLVKTLYELQVRDFKNIAWEKVLREFPGFSKQFLLEVLRSLQICVVKSKELKKDLGACIKYLYEDYVPAVQSKRNFGERFISRLRINENGLLEEYI